MRVFLILLTLVLLIGGIFWFTTEVLRNSSQESEELTELSTNKPKKIVAHNMSDNSKKKETLDETISKEKSVPLIQNDIKVNELPGDNSVLSKEKVEDKEMFEKRVESSSSKEILPDSDNAEKSKIKKNDFSKKLLFVNEKGQRLFGNTTILLQEGAFEVSKGVKIHITKSQESGDWSFIIFSDEYYLDLKKNVIFNSNNYVPVFKIESLKEFNAVILSQYSIIEISLKFSDNSNSISDGTICVLSTAAQAFPFLYVIGTVKNNKAIIQSRESGMFVVTNFFAGIYHKSFQKELLLSPGDINSFELELEIGKEQVFRVTSSVFKPLVGDTVLFSLGEENANHLKEIRNYFASKGLLKEDGMSSVTDKDGKGKIVCLPNGDYTCYVFSKEHSEQIFKVKVNDLREIIDLTIKDEEKKSLQIKVTLNNKPYLKEVSFSYFDMNEFNAMHYNKMDGKITSGQIEINNLKQTKYQVQLKNNEFQGETIEFDFRETNHIEHIFELKPSEYFIHGFIKNKKGDPLKGLTVRFSEGANLYRVKTDSAGYYKVGGLEKEKGYSPMILSEYPEPIGLPKLVYPAKEEFNIILEDIAYFSGKVLGLDGKPVPAFYVDFTCYEGKNFSGARSQTSNNFENGEFKFHISKYGHFEIRVKIPNAPYIHKEFPVLTAADNFPIIIQAEPGFSITGIVRDFEGKSVEGVSITRSEKLMSNANRVDWETIKNVNQIVGEIIKTDKNGYFKLDNCLAEEVYWFVKKGHVPLSIKTKEEDKNVSLNLSFVKSFQLKGTFLTSNKTPHAQIQVEGYLKANPNYRIETKTGADGSFLVNSIVPGEWMIFFGVVVPKGQTLPMQLMNIIDKDEELHMVFDIPKN